MLLAKKCQFFIYLDLVKIRLEIILNYYEERKETSLTIKNTIFQSPKDRIYFSNALIHAFGQNMPFFLYLDLIKIRLEIMLSEFAMRKGTLF